MKITSVLFLGIFTTITVQAQSLRDLRSHYEGVSPLKFDSLNEEHTVDPNKAYKTEAEEQLAEIKAKEEAEKNARDEQLYLDTDYRFFQSMTIVLGEEDELDHIYKQSQDMQNLAQIKGTDQTVKSELKTIAPQTRLLTPSQAALADARREAILKKIATNGQMVKKCILQNRSDKEPFKGTELSLAWEVNTSGKVFNAQIKSTDIGNKAVENCVLKALGEWSFSDIAKDMKKNSHIEYTYRFNNASKKEVAAQ